MQRAVLLLLCLSAIFALQASLGLSPYTARSPKKVIVQHLHEHDGRTVTRSVFAVGAVDSVPVDGVLQDRDPDIWAAKSSGWEWQVCTALWAPFQTGGPENLTRLRGQHQSFAPTIHRGSSFQEGYSMATYLSPSGQIAVLLPHSPSGWVICGRQLNWILCCLQTLYPLNEEFVDSRILQAPGPHEQLTLPSMELLRREQLEGGKQRLHLQMHLPGPGYFGCLNISGPILEWSLPQPTTLWEPREVQRSCLHSQPPKNVPASWAQ